MAVTHLEKTTKEFSERLHQLNKSFPTMLMHKQDLYAEIFIFFNILTRIFNLYNGKITGSIMRYTWNKLDLVKWTQFLIELIGPNNIILEKLKTIAMSIQNGSMTSHEINILFAIIDFLQQVSNEVHINEFFEFVHPLWENLEPAINQVILPELVPVLSEQNKNIINLIDNICDLLIISCKSTDKPSLEKQKNSIAKMLANLKIFLARGKYSNIFSNIIDNLALNILHAEINDNEKACILMLFQSLINCIFIQRSVNKSLILQEQKMQNSLIKGIELALKTITPIFKNILEATNLINEENFVLKTEALSELQQKDTITHDRKTIHNQFDNLKYKSKLPSLTWMICSTLIKLPFYIIKTFIEVAISYLKNILKIVFSRFANKNKTKTNPKNIMLLTTATSSILTDETVSLQSPSVTRTPILPSYNMLEIKIPNTAIVLVIKKIKAINIEEIREFRQRLNTKNNNGASVRKDTKHYQAYERSQRNAHLLKTHFNHIIYKINKLFSFTDDINITCYQYLKTITSSIEAVSICINFITIVLNNETENENFRLFVGRRFREDLGQPNRDKGGARLSTINSEFSLIKNLSKLQNVLLEIQHILSSKEQNYETKLSF